MQTSDDNLAIAAAGGDLAAFSMLLERQYDRLFRLCFRLTGSQAEAEDLTQDICAALPAKLRHYRGEAAITTWLYRVAVNAAHDRRRRQARRSKAAEGWGDWEASTLVAGGSTAGQAGLQQAYATADAMAADGDVSRVILATDGDFNVGLNSPEALESYIADKRDTGTYLSVLGFGRGNLDDATMQALAQNGNGTASYIDMLSEAQKVQVDQLTGALFPIAKDVKIQLEFNPATVSEYRLIGYETRALRREDFNNDKVDAGDIGAGHQVTALYEVTPLGSAATLNDPLRYGDDTVVTTDTR